VDGIGQEETMDLSLVAFYVAALLSLAALVVTY
jgi:hypothetical protein